MAIEIKHDEELEKVTKGKGKGKASTKAKPEPKSEPVGSATFVFPKDSTMNVIRPNRFADPIWIPSNRQIQVPLNDANLLRFVRSISGVVEL